jgi:O-antigen/teichoic acid export membrane protein/GT2 family glycosyltransferase
MAVAGAPAGMNTPAPPSLGGTGSSALFGRSLLYVVVLSLQTVAAVVVSPVLAYLLGPTEFGSLAAAIALHQALIVFAVLGLDQGLVLQRAADQDSRAVRGLVTVGIVLSMAVTLVIGVTGPLWSRPLGFGGFSSLLIATVLWTAPGAIVLLALAELLTEDRLGPFAAVSVLSAVGGQVFGIALLFSVARTASAYAWGGVISQSSAMVVALICTRPRLAGLRDRAVTTRAFRIGIPMAFSGAAFFVLNAGDRIIVQRDLGAFQVGRYQVAYTVGWVVVLLLIFTSQAWTPRFAGVPDEAERWALLGQSRDELYRLLVPVTLGITLAAPVALRLVAPPTFQPASLLIVVYLVAVSAFPIAASGASERALITMRRAKPLAVVAGVAATINIALNIVLVPAMGIAGAALATVAAFALQAFLQLRVLPKHRKWPAPSTPLVVSALAACALSAASVLIPQTATYDAARLTLACACLPWFIVRLRAARGAPGRRNSAPRLLEAWPGHDRIRGEHADAPEIGAAAHRVPQPMRVVVIDLDEPLPELAADERYVRAWVVGRRHGVPRGAIEVDLTGASEPIQGQLGRLRDEVPDPGDGRAMPAEDRLPTISVIVPTIAQRLSDLRYCVDQLAAQDYPKEVEVLLADNRGSVVEPDVLAALVAGRDGFRIVRETRPGVSAARNAGLGAARNEIIVYTDDDVRADAGWLRSIGTRFAREPELDGITGLILPAELDTPAQLWYERYYGGFSGQRTFEPLTLQVADAAGRPWRRSRVVLTDDHHRQVREFAIYGVGAYAAGANMAFRRSALKRIGGFDIALGTGTPARGGEDLAAIIALLWQGGRIGYEPGAVVYHRHRRGYDDLRRQMRGNGVGFTAMLTSLVVNDAAHAIGVASQLPLAVRRFGGQAACRLARGRRSAAGSPSAQPVASFPRALALDEWRGYTQGPVRYVQSRREASAWSQPHQERT